MQLVDEAARAHEFKKRVEQMQPRHLGVMVAAWKMQGLGAPPGPPQSRRNYSGSNYMDEEGVGKEDHGG